MQKNIRTCSAFIHFYLSYFLLMVFGFLLINTVSHVTRFMAWFQANALAEKNRRDLLAQREREERNVWILLIPRDIYRLSTVAYYLIKSTCAESCRSSGCWSQKMVKWKRRKPSSTAFYFTIRMAFFPFLHIPLLTLAYSVIMVTGRCHSLLNNCYLDVKMYPFWQILGPDSGWFPVPLTEVITSAAVKKAYRKATLCVHPDKLQQRGATIQQKYISEKVFDLLKVWIY